MTVGFSKAMKRRNFLRGMIAAPAAVAAGGSMAATRASTDINAWTVGLAGGLLEGTFIRYAADLAKVLDDGSNLRVIPMVTFGAVGNVTDLLSLHGIDVAITQADVLEHFRREVKIPDIEKKIQYISPLFLAETHIYAREEFKTIKDLTGRKVAFNTPGSAANLTGLVVFQRLGVEVEPVLINNSIALEKMRTGEISAVVHVVGKPNDLFARFKPDRGFHFLPIEYTEAFQDFYAPASLDSTDYPNLIGSGGKIPTIAVPTVLAVFNWPRSSDRYRRVARFIEAYFQKFDQLKQPPFQPKWREINPAGTVAGWTRYRVAEEILARMAPEENAGAPQAQSQTRGQSGVRAQFDEFIDAKGGNNKLTSSQRDALFQKFMEWRRH